MSSEEFDSPRLAINRVYTKRGDSGETSLAGGQRVPKDALRIEAYGTIDELNAFVGLARSSVEQMLVERPEMALLDATLLRVQHELFNAGSILATRPEDVHPKQARVTAEDTLRLEREIDAMNEGLPPLRSFVLAGGSRLNAELHVCRTVCRRAERNCIRLAREESIDAEIVKYLNRLSDAFFVWTRWAAQQEGTREVLWDPNVARRSS
jgi:cob(I)alamin adenosyltransferase